MIVCYFTKNVSAWLTASLQIFDRNASLLPSTSICFLSVCLPTLLDAVLKLFFPLTRSATSGNANSNKSAPTHYAAGAKFFLKKRMAVLPITCAWVLKRHSVWRPIPLYSEVEEYLMQPFFTLILLQKKFGNFSKHWNKSNYSQWDQRNLLTRCVSQINMYAVIRVFQQSSKLKIGKCLIVQVLSSNYYITRFELAYEWKATEQMRCCVSNNIVLYNVSVNHEWTDTNNIVSKFWFMRTFPTDEYSQIISHISWKNKSQVSTNNC